VALPGRVLRGPFARAAKARAGGVLDALLQGRAWIALVAVLLVGIVFFNVDLLELNRNIAQTADRTARIKRENAGLRLQVARLASTERIQKVAAQRGLELPAPGDVRYLRLSPFADIRNAAAHMIEPGSRSTASVPGGAPASVAISPSSVPAAPSTAAPAAAQTPPPAPAGATSSPPAGGAPPTATTPPAGTTAGGAAPARTAPAAPSG